MAGEGGTSRSQWLTCFGFFVALSSPSWAALTFNNSFTNVSAPAQAAISRAENTWAGIFNDNITVTLAIDFQSLGASILGQSSTAVATANYSTVRSALIADADNVSDATLLSNLPASFAATMPAGMTLSGNVEMSLANARALGLYSSTATDAMITFSSGFAWDFDRSDGIGAGLYDFEGVVLHEIAHALGFVSVVDPIDARMAASPPTCPAGGGCTFDPNPLDLFRFSGTAPSLATFSSLARDLNPGGTPFFSDTVNQWSFSTGRLTGDGRQASHWKADELTGIYIGVMDPTLSSGATQDLTAADVRALQLIGWDLAVPEPGTLVLVGAGMLLLVLSNRGRRLGAAQASRPPL